MEINVISGALYTQDGKKIADVKDSSIMLVDEPYKQRTMEVVENIGKTHSITCQLRRRCVMIPRCKECQHCELRNRAESKFTGGYGYGRGYFFCENQETKRLPREAFGNQMPSFIGFGTPEYDTKLTVKTSPRWCPRRKKKE